MPARKKRSTRYPTTLVAAVRYFSDIDVATEFVAKLRWPDGPVCPRCESREYSYLTSRRLWKCKGCKKQYSVKLGTVFEDSPIPLDKWLVAIWMIANCRNGVSSHELGRATGITQKSAWFVLHRVRLAMQTGTFEKLSGEVEVDESYIGGAARFMHPKRRREKFGDGKSQHRHKVLVMGMRERGGDFRAQVIPSLNKDVVQRRSSSTYRRAARSTRRMMTLPEANSGNSATYPQI